MRTLLATALIAAFSFSAAGAPKKKIKTYVGKCAKQAAEYAFTDFGNVPNPDPNLEFDLVSSVLDSSTKDKKTHTYIVKYGEFDGNTGVVIDATVRVTADCKQDGDITKKTVGGYEGD